MGIRTKVEIDTSALGISWQKNTSYRFEVQADFVHEDGGELQPSPEIPELLAFTTNATGPVLVDTTPTNGTADIENYTKVTLNFDRKVIKHSGSIKFYKTTGNELIQTLNVEETDVYLEGSGYSASFNLVGAIQLASTSYYFTVDADAFRDYDGFDSPAIGSGTIAFSTGTAPVLVSSSPTDNSSNVNPTALTLTFDKNMKKGAGYIDIYTSADDELYYRINVTDSRVSIASHVVTVDTTFVLDSDTGYYIKIGSSAFTSTSGLPYAGISNSTALNFTTAAGGLPGGVSDWQIYVNGYALIEFPEGTIPVPSTENTTAHTAGIKLWKVGTSNDTLMHTFYDGVDADIFTGSISVDCLAYLDYGNEYYFTIMPNAYYNSETNLYIPATASQTSALTFNVDYGIYGAGIKTYTGNQSDLAFDASVNYENCVATLLDNAASYTYELTSTIGQFGLGSASPTSTASITGTSTVIRSALSTVRFYPTADATSNGTYTIRVKQGSSTFKTTILAMNYSGTSNTASQTITINSSTTWTPTVDQLLYKNTADILLVGGGGGGWAGGSGGGGGGVLESLDYAIDQASYTVTIGTGGAKITSYYTANAGDGQNTTAFGLTAYGGKGAYGNPYVDPSKLTLDAAHGGDSGAPTAHTGGPAGDGSNAGSGAGAGADGTSGSTSYNGGVGIDSSIFGSYGGSKLGAGGGNQNASALTYQYPRDAGHGGHGGNGSLNSTDTAGAHGIVIIKLKP